MTALPQHRFQRVMVVGVVDEIAVHVQLIGVNNFVNHAAPEELTDQGVGAVINGFQVFGLQIVVFGTGGLFLNAVAGRIVLIAISRRNATYLYSNYSGRKREAEGIERIPVLKFVGFPD